MDSELTFLSGNDIPFLKAGVVIHQPTIKEIGYLGEDAFFTGCELINFSKNMLAEEDKINLEDKSNFDILIAILREHNAVMQKNRNCVEMVLALLFPEYRITLTQKAIVLQKNGEVEKHSIDRDNFEDFKIIFNKIFSFKKDDTKEYNPGGDLAKKLAEKFNKRKQVLAQVKNDKNKKISILNRYVSILAVGEKKDMNELLKYTVYQLYDEYDRFQLKMAYDINIKAKLAGAKDLKEAEDWMKDIHSEE